MKFLILSLCITSIGLTAEIKKVDPGSPANAVSSGQSDTSGISESPTGTTKQEAEEYRDRAGSMGGAPNAGGGMGTGTGAGSTVGKELDEGINAGSLGDDAD